MAGRTFKIYSADGETVRYEGKGLTYHGSYLSPSYIEFKEIATDTIIDWQVGDYVDYARTGFRYKLYQLPQTVQNSEKVGVNGQRVVYSSITFYAPTKDLEYALYLDLVEADNTIHFSTQEDIATYEDVQGIATRIQACLDYFYPDSWTVKIMDGLSTNNPEILEARDFQMTAGQTLLDALNNIYSVWDTIGWTYSYDSSAGKNVLTIGGANIQTTANTVGGGGIGKNDSLTKLKFTIANNSDLCTRLYAFGSSRNLPARYYNSQDIKDAESVDIQNLMIPLDKWGKTDGLPDANQAYIDSSDAQALFGVRPKVLYFDDEEYGEYYPSIEGLTIGDVRAGKASVGDTTYVPSTGIYKDEDERIDEILAAGTFPDDGVIPTSAYTYEESVDASGSRSATGTNMTLGDTSNPFAQTYQTVIKPYPTVAISATNPIATVAAPAGDTVTAKLYVKWDGSTKEYDLNVAHTSGKKSFNLSLPSGISLSPNDLYDYKTSGGKINLYFYIVATVTSTTSEKKMLTVNGTFTVKCKSGNDPYFSLDLKQIGFNIEAQRATQSGSIGVLELKDGMCAGRSFKIISCTYQQAIDAWHLTLKRVTDTSVGMIYPNTTYKIANGDHFVLTGILMPNIYVLAQEQRLYDRAKAVLDELSRPIVVIEPSINSVKIQNDIDDQTTSEAPAFLEGKYFDFESTVYDQMFEDWQYLKIIDSVTIVESENTIPTFSITLREKKHRSFKTISESSYSESTTEDTDSDSSSSSSSSGSGGAVISSIDVQVNGESHKADSDGVVSLPTYEFGTETSQYVQTNLNGSKKNLSLSGHTHDQYITDAPSGEGKSYCRKDGAWAEVTVDVSGKADKTYVDSELAKKANLANTYTKSQVDSALEAKADKATTLAGYGIEDAYTKNETDSQILAKTYFEPYVVNGKTYLRLLAETADGTTISGLYTQEGQSLSAEGVGEDAETPAMTTSYKVVTGSESLIGDADNTLDEWDVTTQSGAFSLTLPSQSVDGYVHRLILRNKRTDKNALGISYPSGALKSNAVSSISYGTALYAEYYWLPSGTLVMDCSVLS